MNNEEQGWYTKNAQKRVVFGRGDMQRVQVGVVRGAE